MPKTTSGPASEVVKLLPALTCAPDELDEGLAVLAQSVREAVGADLTAPVPSAVG